METTVRQSPLSLRWGATHSNPKDAPVQVVRQVSSRAQALDICMTAARLQQATLAEALHVDPSYVSRWLSESRPIPDKWIDRICKATGSNLLRQHADLERALMGHDPVAFLAAQLQVAA